MLIDFRLHIHGPHGHLEYTWIHVYPSVKQNKIKEVVSPVPEANVNRHKRKGKNVCERCKRCVPEHHLRQPTISIVCGRKNVRPDGDNETCLSLELQSQFILTIMAVQYLSIRLPNHLHGEHHSRHLRCRHRQH
nr:uncharacterized protein LOC109410029 [Aedes albopictus]